MNLVPAVSGTITARDGKGTALDVTSARVVAHALTAEGHDASEDGTGRGTPLVVESVALRGRGGGATAELGGDLATALRASQGGGDKPHVMAGMAVRRLTPRECERLMGLPDDWTAHDAAGEPISDSARYRMLGNSVAVPVVEWLGRQLRRATGRRTAETGGGR